MFLCSFSTFVPFKCKYLFDRLTGGELLHRLVREDSLTESEVAFYIKQVLKALEHMHSRHIMHLDIKASFIHHPPPPYENNENTNVKSRSLVTYQDLMNENFFI